MLARKENIIDINKFTTSNQLLSNFFSSEVGIDKINFYTPGFFLDLKNLAKYRKKDYQEYLKAGQFQVSVLPPDEDIVTMGYNAAYSILTEIDKEKIDLLLFATESSIDQSKSAGSFIHKLLNLSSRCRVIELKHACYGGTAGLQLAMNILRAYGHDKKILLISSDVSRYGLNSNAESSQGCGAIAMLLTKNPRILSIEPESGIYTEDVMDFWRPNHLDEALLDGKFSCQMYIKSLKKTWSDYVQNSKRNLFDHQWFCYHVSVPRLIKTAHLTLFSDFKKIIPIEELMHILSPSLIYSQKIGNCYTSSLFLSFISLITNVQDNIEGSRVAFYSYGSGSIGEFFSGVVQKNANQLFLKEKIRQRINNRKEIDVQIYENFYKSHIDITKKSLENTPQISSTAYVRLAKVIDNKRCYEIF